MRLHKGPLTEMGRSEKVPCAGVSELRSEEGRD